MGARRGLPPRAISVDVRLDTVGPRSTSRGGSRRVESLPSRYPRRRAGTDASSPSRAGVKRASSSGALQVASPRSDLLPKDAARVARRSLLAPALDAFGAHRCRWTFDEHCDLMEEAGRHAEALALIEQRIEQGCRPGSDGIDQARSTADPTISSSSSRAYWSSGNPRPLWSASSSRVQLPRHPMMRSKQAAGSFETPARVAVSPAVGSSRVGSTAKPAAAFEIPTWVVLSPEVGSSLLICLSTATQQAAGSFETPGSVAVSPAVGSSLVVCVSVAKLRAAGSFEIPTWVVLSPAAGPSRVGSVAKLRAAASFEIPTWVVLSPAVGSSRVRSMAKLRAAASFEIPTWVVIYRRSVHPGSSAYRRRRRRRRGPSKSQLGSSFHRRWFHSFHPGGCDRRQGRRRQSFCWREPSKKRFFRRRGGLPTLGGGQWTPRLANRSPLASSKVSSPSASPVMVSQPACRRRR
jgi:hypothetical protein